MKNGIKALLLGLFFSLALLGGRNALAATSYTVELDPGHGGSDGGCGYTWNGVRYQESAITLKIAKYCRQYLKAHAKNLKIYMTRSTDIDVGVSERVEIAARDKADLLVSFHINDAGMPHSANGCMVLVARGVYRAYIAKKEEVFTDFVLKELHALGLNNSTGSDNGRYYRTADSGEKYPNGKLMDYYTIICESVLADFPGVIIEHAFLSNYTESIRFLSSNAKLKALGEADARAIIAYFNSDAADPDFGKTEEELNGWVIKDGKYYYRNKKGKYLKSQWLTLDGKRYYLTEDGSRATGLVTIGSKIYLFNKYGVAGKGRVTVDGNIYVCTKTGALRFKWYHTAADNFYYLYPKGSAKQGQALANGSYIINGKVYTFNAKGYCTNFHFAKKATSKQKTTLETVA
ncbi:MAG: N-acetylmuramoyl-L-alanine amidase [Blautia sp.]|nr:N-acetylmuramoyl-L-alanine amidase [Blautia sp.]